MLLATCSAFLGLGLGCALYVRPVVSPSIFREKLPWAYNILQNKYYFDEFYWAVLVVPLFWITKTLAIFDARIVDGLVNGVGYITLGFAIAYSWFDRVIVDGLVNLVGGVTRLSGRVLRYGQTGVLQNYALVAFTGVLVLAWFYLFRW
jgi:NADH-quinone oxidoreductase subunit L